MRPAFLYCACQVGAEAALRLEIAAIDPTLRSAFARPGLVTFKIAPESDANVEAMLTAIATRSVLARACGGSFGPAKGPAEFFDALRKALPSDSRARFEVWERDRWRPGEEPSGFSYGPAAAAIREQVIDAWPEDLERAGTGTDANTKKSVGDLVAELIVGDPGEPWLVGLHRHRPGQLPYSGGRIPLEEQPLAPSRAYYKLEEALVYADVPVRAGDVAVELGSAPGGASFALLRRGLDVHGVDPGAMDPVVLDYNQRGHNRFTHHACTMSHVQRRDLPRALQWIVADVNLAPQIALQTVRRLGARPRPALLGVLLTLKIDNWKAMRHLPGWLRQVEAMGMTEVGTTQLSRNRMEVFAYGLTPAGVTRRRSAASP